MLVYVRSGLDVRLLELTGSCRSSGAGPPLQDWLSLSLYIYYITVTYYIYTIMFRVISIMQTGGWGLDSQTCKFNT